MNILYITFTSGGGGATTALANVVKGMVTLGHKVWVLSRNNEGPLPEMIEAVGGQMLYGPVSLTIYPMSGCFIGKMKRLFQSIINWRKSRKLVASIIKQYDINVVHSNVGPMNLALKVCQKAGIPHVWHLREYQELDFKMHFFPTKKTFRKLIHENGNYNVAITKGVFEHYKLRTGVDTVVYDGVFPETAVSASFIEQKENYFLFVGRIEEAKGPHVIIKPFAEFHKEKPGYRLKLAGSYSNNLEYYENLKDLVADYNLEDSVEILGNRDDVYDLMKKACALIVPSRFEGFGFITAEGMLNNCLVIGRNTAGTKEQFDVGKTVTGQEIGLRFNTDEELLQCMFKAVEEDSTQIRERARSVVVQNYTLEKGAKDLQAFYEKSIRNYYKGNPGMIKKILGGAVFLFSKIWTYKKREKITKWKNDIRSMWLSREFKYAGEHVKFKSIGAMKGTECITIGARTIFDEGLFLTAWTAHGTPSITIGQGCNFGAFNHITAINNITIGDNCLTGKSVTITDNSHGEIDRESLNIPPNKRKVVSKGPVIIGNNVWIGDKATILPNVTIGDGSIIAANAVVGKDIPPYCVAAGIPAKIIKDLREGNKKRK